MMSTNKNFDEAAADAEERRTKRRYAHEIYPHGEEFDVRSLAVEVPYLYARAIGFEVRGTSWFDTISEATHERTMRMIESRQIALMADAMQQGLTGQEAWEWAESHMDEIGEWAYERAAHHGVDLGRIKPYLCGPEPDHHEHDGPADARGWRVVTRIKGKESECDECTEPVL